MPVVTMSHAEWLAEAKRRFGESPANWKFRCPQCGNEATCGDFKEAGADPQRAPQECIGRVDPSLGGCDWAAFGLLRITNTEVATDDGGRSPVFDFAAGSS